MNAIASAFGKAAQSYAQGATLQRRVASDSLAYLPSTIPNALPDVLLDVGCGPGWFHAQLAARCQRLWALDMSPAMLAQVAKHHYATRLLLGDACDMPLAAGCVDVLYSSLMAQWLPAPLPFFQDIERVLSPQGRFIVTTLVDGSLTEFNHAWNDAGYISPALGFLPSESVLAAAQSAGLDCRGEVKTYTLYFPDVVSMAREFKLLGANHVASRHKGLSGKDRWRAFASAYERYRTEHGLPLSYQVLFLAGERR